jgi:hypothetical protein
MMKVGTKEKGHFSNTIISQWLYVTLKKHVNKDTEEGEFPDQSWGWPFSNKIKQE